MNGIPAPFVASDEPTIWAIPHQTGDVQYATIVNWGFEDGKNAGQVVKPQTGTLKWNTTRPIYDVRLGHRITAEAARSIDEGWLCLLCSATGAGDSACHYHQKRRIRLSPNDCY